MSKHDAPAFYLAGRWEARARLRKVARRIEKLTGYHCCATWLWRREAKGPGALEKYSLIDVADIRRSNFFYLDTFDLDDRGGREFELGVAYERELLEIICVGPQRSIFHHLPEVQFFDSWEKLFDFLAHPS